MAKVRVPYYLADVPAQELEEWLRLHKMFVHSKIAEKMVDYYEGKLEKLIMEEEKESPLNWFQSKWERVKRLGKRELIRSVIKDLKL